MPERPSHEDIRLLVRDVLREVLSGGAASGAARDRQGEEETRLAARLREGARQGGEISVALATDDDLARFAWSMAQAAGDGELAAALAKGRLRLRMAAPSGGQAFARATASGDGRRDAEHRVDSGVVNESRVAQIAKTHARLVLGPRAVLTPLAKDRAREAKLEIVRRKP